MERQLIGGGFGVWQPLDEGVTFGLPGSEGGITVRDEEHELGARATLERDCQHSPWAVTCGIYGWFFHTRFLGSEAEAEFPAMLDGLAAILAIIHRRDDSEADAKRVSVYEAIDKFVARFP
ncbi:MAG: hypothetical protein LM514_03880 [Streptococcus sp.]|jgi:hypothetical protein|nr:hypothetical protein [Streptococcus sp.]